MHPKSVFMQLPVARSGFGVFGGGWGERRAAGFALESGCLVLHMQSEAGDRPKVTQGVIATVSRA